MDTCRKDRLVAEARAAFLLGSLLAAAACQGPSEEAPPDMPPVADAFVFVTNYNEPNRVYYTNDALSFVGMNATDDNHGSHDVALGDLDGDGDLDALVANYGTNRVYRNDGGLVFSGFDATDDVNDSYGVAIGDFSGK